MNSSDDRRSPRVNVLIKAAVEFGKSQIPVRINNLSAHGALVVGENLPPCDSEVVFHCNQASIAGWVMWKEANRAGIQFQEPVSPETLVHKDKGIPVVITPDDRKGDFRRPGFRGNQLSAEERRIIEEWQRLESKSNGAKDT